MALAGGRGVPAPAGGGGGMGGMCSKGAKYEEDEGERSGASKASW